MVTRCERASQALFADLDKVFFSYSGALAASRHEPEVESHIEGGAHRACAPPSTGAWGE